MVVPVLTAHPTEVRRKSTIDREMEVAELMAERDRGGLTPAELAANELALRRAVLTLWQTNLVRKTRLRVIDEIANGLSFYDYTFLSELPRLYADLEEALREDGVELPNGLPSFFRMGSWIGSDRDGNPFVTEAVLRAALEAQSGRALRHYLDELHLLGGELSLDRKLVGVSAALEALAARSPDRSVNRQDEPYRRAITGIYARLAATAAELGHVDASQRAVGDAPPYVDPDELLADLAAIDASLVANGCAILANGRLQHLRRAVDVFGFHLASLDLRQNSEVHERVVGEMFGLVQPGLDYAALAEPQRINLLLAELGTARPLASPFLAYSDETASELAILRATARGASPLRPRLGAALRDLESDRHLRHPRNRCAGQGSGAVTAIRRRARDRYRAAVRNHRGSAQLRTGHGRAFGIERTGICSTAAGVCRRSCSAIPTATRMAVF